jgi:ribosomal protein L11 methyltransferase
MRWVELSAAVDEESLENLVSILGKYGQGGAAVEENRTVVTGIQAYVVKIYIPSSRRFKAIRQEIEKDLQPFSIHLRERFLRPSDWFNSLKDHFHSTQIGQKLVIKPSWIDQPLPPDRVVIELDPGIAFGTGVHPTTRLCLLRLEQHILPGMSLLDLGCGTGILAISAAKLAHVSGLALDIDPVAVKSALNNIKANFVESLVRVRRGTLSLRRQGEFKDSFDIAVANISAAALSEMAPRLFAVLKKGGILIGTGLNSQQLDEVLIKFALAGFQIIAVDSEEEWRAVVARKPARD